MTEKEYQCVNCSIFKTSKAVREINHSLSYIDVKVGPLIKIGSFGIGSRWKFKKEDKRLQEVAKYMFIQELIKAGFNPRKWSNKSPDKKFRLCKECIEKVKSKGVNCIIHSLK